MLWCVRLILLPHKRLANTAVILILDAVGSKDDNAFPVPSFVQFIFPDDEEQAVLPDDLPAEDLEDGLFPLTQYPTTHVVSMPAKQRTIARLDLSLRHVGIFPLDPANQEEFVHYRSIDGFPPQSG